MLAVRFGFVLPGGSAPDQLELAVAADGAGWDGVFVWEAAYGVDAWSLLSAMAVRTSRVKLGTMLTPLPFRRPWKVASQVATLHDLSGGRAVLSVALGAVDPGLGTVRGEPTDRPTRAALLDEGIDVVRALWTGELHYEGSRFGVDFRDTHLTAGLRLETQPALWCVGAVPHEKSMHRVRRCDGWIVFPNEPDAVRTGLGMLDGASVDVIVEGETEGPDDVAQVQAFADAGATWWMETRWMGGDPADRIAAGPPRLA